MQINTFLAPKIIILCCINFMLFACDSDSYSEHQHSKPGNTLAANDADNEQKPFSWEMLQETDAKKFSVKFSCQTQPAVGDFQVCNLHLSSEGVAASDASIAIDGGMKAHGHGLPTSPKIITTDVPGKYRIDGLKFSMQGEWIVGFKISLDEMSDQTVFKLSI